MNKERSYLDYRNGTGWASRGAITPLASEHYKTEPYRWRQLNNLQLPQLGEVFRPSMTFKPFKWARQSRSTK